MPAKFVVQARLDRQEVKRATRERLDVGEPKLSERVWVDTVWPSLEVARYKHPLQEYREVMLQW